MFDEQGRAAGEEIVHESGRRDGIARPETVAVGAGVPAPAPGPASSQWRWEMTCQQTVLDDGMLCAELTIRSRFDESTRRIVCQVSRGEDSWTREAWRAGPAFLPDTHETLKSTETIEFPRWFEPDPGSRDPYLRDGEYRVRWTGWEVDPDGIGMTDGHVVVLFEGTFRWPCSNP